MVYLLLVHIMTQNYIWVVVVFLVMTQCSTVLIVIGNGVVVQRVLIVKII